MHTDQNKCIHTNAHWSCIHTVHKCTLIKTNAFTQMHTDIHTTYTNTQSTENTKWTAMKDLCTLIYTNWTTHWYTHFVQPLHYIEQQWRTYAYFVQPLHYIDKNHLLIKKERKKGKNYMLQPVKRKVGMFSTNYENSWDC